MTCQTDLQEICCYGDNNQTCNLRDVQVAHVLGKGRHLNEPASESIPMIYYSLD
jgi:hypothetical protein